MTNTLPLVSTIIPAYNHERFVASAICSVAKQTYKNIELIVIDDGSKDRTPQIIESLLADLRPRFSRLEFRSRANIGLSATISEALPWCKGEYIQMLASDDLYEKEKTSAQVSILMSDQKAIAAFSGYSVIDNNGIVSEIKRFSSDRRYNFEDIFLSRYKNMQPGSAMYRASVLKSVCLDPSNGLEDLQIFLATLKTGGEFIHTPDLLFRYRWHQDNTCSERNSEKLLIKAKEVLEKYKDHPLYDNVISELDLMSFYQLSARNKSLALKFLSNAARRWNSLRFLSGLLRLATPIPIYNLAVKVRGLASLMQSRGLDKLIYK